MRHSFLGYCLLALLMGGAAPAWANAHDRSYIEAQTLPPLLLVPPPAEGSAGWRQQEDKVIAAQRGLTADQIAAIRDEQKMRVGLMTSVMGPDFTPDRLPRVFVLLDRSKATAHMAAEADKQYWRTRRPYLTDPKVTLYVDRIDDSPSYPSGHTTESLVLAEIMGLLVPDRSAGVRARADEIARHRIEAGAHYPADIEGGRNLAMLVIGALMASDDFQSDLAAAKQELAAR